jgi:hypothetical protein
VPTAADRARRERSAHRLTRFGVVLQFVALIGLGWLIHNIANTQTRIRDVACAQAEGTIAAPTIRNPDQQTVLQWALSVQARINLLDQVEGIGCPGANFEERRRVAEAGFVAILAGLENHNPSLADQVAGRKPRPISATAKAAPSAAAAGEGQPEGHSQLSNPTGSTSPGTNHGGNGRTPGGTPGGHKTVPPAEQPQPKPPPPSSGSPPSLGETVKGILGQTLCQALGNCK